MNKLSTLSQKLTAKWQGTTRTAAMKSLLIALILFAGCINSKAERKPAAGGYPIANFALTANVSEQGDLFGQILQNKGKLGEWLANRGEIRVLVEKDGQKEELSHFKEKNVSRRFPMVNAFYQKSRLIASTIKLQAFCPLALNDLELSSLPVLMLEMECENPGKKADSFFLTLNPADGLCTSLETKNSGNIHAVGNKGFLMAVDAEAERQGNALRIPVNLKGKEKKRFRIALSLYDEDWISANQFPAVDDVVSYAYRMWSILETKTLEFSQAIPSSGDEEIDTYLRWYMVPAISLTRYNKRGELLTLGYMELNPRDSYWTSWVHLAFFKEAERKMIEECLASVTPAGKMPTTILPLIEREDDLDINAFLILRVARFYQFYHEKEKLKTYWPVLKKAMEWLIARDQDGIGLPKQISFWGDWKDVPGVSGRAYSPFSCLIYLAALKQMIYLGKECGDPTAVQRFEEAFAKGHETINKDVRHGGLWNGRYYCQLWKDGSVNDKLLEDQTIGILFDVVPEERALSIINSLNEMSLTPYGVAETFPYYPEEFGLEPATYHNGAVWPWVNFMDCWARIRLGKREEALDIIKRVGHADIVASGDWSANEHINSLTGENLGFHIQGWNAALFGTIYFGLVHPGIVF